MKRIGALVVAVALVAGAILVNRAIHDDALASDEDSPATRPRVTCATEFAALCKTLDADADVTVESPGTTVAALVADPTPTFDLWITSRPWPELATLRAGRPVGLGSPEPLASTPLSAVALDAAATRLSASCSGTVSGRCVMAAPPKLGVTSTTYTPGLLSIAFLLSGWPDLVDAGTGDIEANDLFVQELIGLKAKRVETPDPLTTILQLPRYEVGLDIDVGTRLAAAARRDDFQALDTAVTAVAVAVPAATGAGRAALQRLGPTKLGSALADRGWSNRIPEDDGLPDPAVLDYLVSQWNRR